MKLSQEDVKLFYKLHPALLFYGNQKLKVIGDVPTIDEFMKLPSLERLFGNYWVLPFHLNLSSSIPEESIL